MAGLRGPVRNDDQPGVIPGKGDGDVIFATGGRMVLPGVSTDGFVKDCSKTFGSSEKGLPDELCACEK
jgi:hypothetical protein